MNPPDPGRPPDDAPLPVQDPPSRHEQTEPVREPVTDEPAPPVRLA